MKALCKYCKFMVEDYGMEEGRCGLSLYKFNVLGLNNEIYSRCIHDESLKDLFESGNEAHEIKTRDNTIKILTAENEQLKKILDFVRQDKTKKEEK